MLFTPGSTSADSSSQQQQQQQQNMSSSDALSSSSTASHARTISNGSTTRGNSISVNDASSLPGGGIEVISRADFARDNALLQLVRMGFTQVTSY
jgi:hypothetical protein